MRKLTYIISDKKYKLAGTTSLFLCSWGNNLQKYIFLDYFSMKKGDMTSHPVERIPINDPWKMKELNPMEKNLIWVIWIEGLVYRNFQVSRHMISLSAPSC
jgi:hypothetical protein